MYQSNSLVLSKDIDEDKVGGVEGEVTPLLKIHNHKVNPGGSKAEFITILSENLG